MNSWTQFSPDPLSLVPSPLLQQWLTLQKIVWGLSAHSLALITKLHVTVTCETQFVEWVPSTNCLYDAGFWCLSVLALWSVEVLQARQAQQATHYRYNTCLQQSIHRLAPIKNQYHLTPWSTIPADKVKKQQRL